MKKETAGNDYRSSPEGSQAFDPEVDSGVRGFFIR